MRKIIYMLMCPLLLGSCHIYRNYERPEGLPVDSLYREPVAQNDTVSLGDLPWEELFHCPKVRILYK